MKVTHLYQLSCSLSHPFALSFDYCSLSHSHWLERWRVLHQSLPVKKLFLQETVLAGSHLWSIQQKHHFSPKKARRSSVTPEPSGGWLVGNRFMRQERGSSISINKILELGAMRVTSWAQDASTSYIRHSPCHDEWCSPMVELLASPTPPLMTQ